MNFKDMLLNAMTDGASLDDVMKGITSAATEIEKDKAAAASKYDVYNKPLFNSYNSITSPHASPSDAIVFATKISVKDMTTVLLHFLCQNVPGFSQALAETHVDPVSTYSEMLKRQLRSAEVITKHKNESDEAKSKALLDHLFSEVMDEVFKGVSEPYVDSLKDAPATKTTKDKQPPIASRLADIPAKPVLSPEDLEVISDCDKLAKFFKDIGLA